MYLIINIQIKISLNNKEILKLFYFKNKIKIELEGYMCFKNKL